MFLLNSSADTISQSTDCPDSTSHHQDTHKKNCMSIISSLDLDSSLFKFGVTQVFFKAGVLNKLEDERDKRINHLIVKLQAHCRRYLTVMAADKRRIQSTAIKCIQKNVRISFLLKKWKWWRLYTQLMPIINVQNSESLIKQYKEELDDFRRKNERLNSEKNDLLVMNSQLENKVSLVDFHFGDSIQIIYYWFVYLAHEYAESMH